MGGQWVTSRQLFENGQLTDQITQMNMAIQMNECGAEGTLGENGKIFQASFAGRVANNLLGKWSLGGEDGTFNIQLQNNEKDCSSFDGMMYSGDKKWKWTGHKEAISTLRSCDAECKDRDPHLNWNGKDEYPNCNCVCEAGWEFDASGKSCVLAGTSAINPCETECKARAPAGQLSHMVWNGDTSQYPYCNCLCDSGYEFDAAGKYCVPIQASNANPSESTPAPSGSTSAVGSQEGPQLLVTNSEGTSSLNQGGIIQSKVTESDPVILQLKCGDLVAEMNLMRLMWDHKDNELITENEYPFIRIFLVLAETWKKLCPLTRVDYDTPAFSNKGESPIEIKTELQQGSIQAEVVNDQVALDIETPNVIVSSQGKNTFGVAYDPTSGKSYVAAYQYPIQVQPTGGSQAPFKLESGQEVKIGNGQVTPLSSPLGQTPGVDTGQNQNPGFVHESSEGGCYTDPVTREIVCVDSSGKPSNQQGTQESTSIIVPVENQGCSWSGTWSSNWGEQVMHQSGDQVSGTYTHDQGKIVGTVSGTN